MKEIVNNLIKEAAYHKAAYENTMRYLDGGMQKTASPLDFIMDGMSPASLGFDNDIISQSSDALMGMGGLSSTGAARIKVDEVNDAIREFWDNYLKSNGLSFTGAARIKADEANNAVSEFLNNYLKSNGLSYTGAARIKVDEVNDAISDYLKSKGIAEGIANDVINLGKDTVNSAYSTGKNIKDILSNWGNAIFGSNNGDSGSEALKNYLSDINLHGDKSVLNNPAVGVQKKLLNILGQSQNGNNSFITMAGPDKLGPDIGSSMSVYAQNNLYKMLDKAGKGDIVSSAGTELLGPGGNPWDIFNHLKWKDKLRDMTAQKRQNLAAWIENMQSGNSVGMDTFKNFLSSFTGKDLGIAAGAAGLGGLGMAANKNLQNNKVLAIQQNVAIKELQKQLQQQVSQNNSLTANLGARLRNAGNSALQAIKNNPKTSLAIGAGAAGLAALPFLMGRSEKNSSYDPYRLQMLRNALINMR